MKEKIPYRQIHLDFHTSEHIGGVGSRFDADEFTQTLLAAHVNSINIFGKCHHGYFYYPSRVGEMHPGLNGRNLLGEQTAALKKAGIRYTIYTCVGWNEAWSRKHPEWREIDKNGVLGLRAPLDRRYYRWDSLCLNKAGYRKILREELAEEYELFKPAGYWIDIVGQSKCVCPDCLAKMKELNLDPKNDSDINKCGRIMEIDFMREMHAFLKEKDQNLEIYFNSRPYEIDDAGDYELSSAKKREYFDYVDIESLWDYAHFPMAANYLDKYDVEYCLMNGKFHLAWGDFGSLRNQEALEYECFRAVAYGARSCIGDQMHPSGKLDPVAYERIGKVFASIEQKEPWLVGTKKICDVGVICNVPVNQGDAMRGSDPEMGAYRILRDLKIPFDFVNFHDDLSVYKLIILPDDNVLPPAMVEKINTYIRHGGKILVTGKAGVTNGQFVLDAIPAVYVGESEHETRYMRFTGQDFRGIPHIDHVLYLKGQTVDAKPGAKVLAKIVPPYFNRTPEHFCSHRQTPPMPDEINEPAIIRGDDSIFISHPLFSDFAVNGYRIYKDIVYECVKILLGRLLIETDLPVMSDVTLRSNDGGVVVHTLTYAITRKCEIDTIEDVIELANKRYKIFTGFKPSNVCLVPEGREINYIYSDGFVNYMLEYQKGHSMVYIKK